MDEPILFYDIDRDIPVPEDFGSFPHIVDQVSLNDMEVTPDDTATGFGFLVPPLGRNKFDGHIYISGATGSGKSFFINRMLMGDKRKRRVFMFTDLPKRDPSLSEIFETGRLKVVRTFPEHAWEVSHTKFASKMKKSIIVFDDCSNPDALQMRDNALLKGRHQDIVVICVNHKLREMRATARPLNEAKYVVAFPSSNRGSVTNFLKDWFDLRRLQRQEIIKISRADGRHIIMHMHSPNTVATSKTIIKV